MIGIVLLQRVSAGDLEWRYTDSDPRSPDPPPEEPGGFTGGARSAMSVVRIHTDRVELQDVWCYTMGHAEVYVECGVKRFARDDRELMKILATKFRPALVAEVSGVLGLARAPVTISSLRSVFVDRDVRFGLEVDPESHRAFVSIPVSNSMTDYLEYYEVDAATFEAWRADPTLAHDFVAKAKRRELDHLLLLEPGKDRGWA